MGSDTPQVTAAGKPFKVMLTACLRRLPRACGVRASVPRQPDASQAGGGGAGEKNIGLVLGGLA